jgi:hypothetical protein
MPTFVHGKNAVFKVGTAAAPTVATDISTYLDTVSYPRTMDTAETTTFGANARSYIPSFPGNTFSISGKFDPGAAAIDFILAALQGLPNAVALEYGPAGSTTGNPKYTMVGNTTGQGTTNPGVFLTNYAISSPVNDVVSFTADFVGNLAVSRSTY